MSGIIAQKYLAEFVGTMFLLLVIVSTGGEALAVGAALAIAIMVVGKCFWWSLEPCCNCYDGCC